MAGFLHSLTVSFLFISILILSIGLNIVWKSKHYCSNDIRYIILIAILASVFHVMSILLHNEKLVLLFMNLFSASFSWLVLYFKKFSNKYTKSGHEIKLVVIGCYIYCIIETIAFIINTFYPLYFTLTITEFQGEAFYKINSSRSSLYTLHLLFSYILISLILIENIFAIIKSPKLYKRKYVEVLLAFIIPVFIDMLYVFTRFPVDISVLAFGIGGIILEYFAIFYSPSEVRKGMLFNVFDDTDVGVVCFDKDGSAIFVNNQIRELFNISDNTNDFSRLENYFITWQQEHPEWKENQLIKWDESFERGGKLHYYEVSFSVLLDDKKMYLGSYFIIQDNTDLMNKLNEQRYLATHDYLTGVYNRETFYKKVAKVFADQPDRDFIIITSNIKGFKLINDVFGQSAGDKILKQIANALKALSKESSIYARLHSDCFVLCMPAERYDEKWFLDMAYQSVSVDGSDIYRIRMAIGVYVVTNKSLPVSVMCDRSLLALASIKSDYSKSIAYYSDEMRDHAIQEQNIAALLEKAMEKEQFTIFLQPQLDLNGKLFGAEALVRWFQPEKGLVMPIDFISIFEKTGSIAKLDYCVWEMACKTLRRWKDEGRKDCCISVNISPKDFYFTDVFEDITSLVKKYNIEPSMLNLEITESAIMFDLEKQLNLLKKLQDFGFKIEMDDFGSGYSSLNSLKDITVDYLKLDMAFLATTNNTERSKKIIRIILQMAKELELPVITEGVETEEQLNFMKSAGGKLFQGHYFSKPLSVSEFEEKYLPLDTESVLTTSRSVSLKKNTYL